MTVHPQMYPSPDELFQFPELGTALRMDLKARYAEHGAEYLTDKQHEDGRVMNGCMFSNSAQDALEEATDVVFNLAVLRLKGYAVHGMLARAQALWNDLALLKGHIDREGV